MFRTNGGSMSRMRLLAPLALLMVGWPIHAQQYAIDRATDGPFAVKIFGIDFNKGSTLQRERILLNIPSCPVQLTSSSLRFDYQERGFKYKVQTGIQVQQAVTAFEIRHILYDVFGDHMQNLSNVEARDFAAGLNNVEGTWSAYRENDVTEHLTTVTYVAAVRFSDGKTWKFPLEPLMAALRGLNLEQKIEDDARRPRP
jgi:hypothetical protein